MKSKNTRISLILSACVLCVGLIFQNCAENSNGLGGFGLGSDEGDDNNQNQSTGNQMTISEVTNITEGNIATFEISFSEGLPRNSVLRWSVSEASDGGANFSESSGLEPLIADDINSNENKHIFSINTVSDGWDGIDDTYTFNFSIEAESLAATADIVITETYTGLKFAGGGDDHNCWIYNKQIQCAGGNGTGELGDQDNNTSIVAKKQGTFWQAGDKMAEAVDGGDNFNCAIIDGGAYCWGSDDTGQIGDGGGRNTRRTPTLVTGLDSGVTDISVGHQHACAVQDGGLKCWGRNDFAQISEDPQLNAFHTAPIEIFAAGSGVTQVHSGRGHNCAIVNNAVQCWGRNDDRQSGQAGNADVTSPTAVVGLEDNVSLIGGGYNHTCVVQNTALKCWGYNDQGQLGNGTRNDSQNPVTITDGNLTDKNITSISGSTNSTCIVADGAEIYCWGENNNYEVIGTDTTRRTTPVKVLLPEAATGQIIAVGSGNNQHCATLNDAGTMNVYCWGRNDSGSLGIGVNGGSIQTPSRVIFQ